ncbi:hypothetical protein [Cryobacterium aureum]|uniref:hypothetical protein n=1 Tax=Cryobacterium aureum TaxID=995037 RepID=UPI001374C001|nr:hypothetical protein [Cryobacterium aureum]
MADDAPVFADGGMVPATGCPNHFLGPWEHFIPIDLTRRVRSLDILNATRARLDAKGA